MHKYGFSQIFYPDGKVFLQRIPIYYTKHLPMDLGHQEVPKGGKKETYEIILTIFLYLQVASALQEE